MQAITYPDTVERWGVLEIRIHAAPSGNPFTDCRLSGLFTEGGVTRTAEGFYDGGDTFVIRYMPEEEGRLHFGLEGGPVFADLLPLEGTCLVTPPSGNNHGPVRVRGTRHFSYADGTPYLPFGTTCYAWVHQPEELQRETLRTLRDAPFNKIRFCIFPKHYDYNYAEPLTYPYEGTPCSTEGLDRSTMQRFTEEKAGSHWDFTRFNPAHFARIEKRIADLAALGIEADLILFHPYDRWGFDGMGTEYDDLYVRYCISRFAAYRNVWWSLANEYDYIRTKTVDDWERIAGIICRDDPYGHLRSIHNGPAFYDFHKQWPTHLSLQGTDRYRSVERTEELLAEYGRPLIWDEVLYEGNIDLGWGNITGEEMTRRFWEGVLRGGYAGHGETLLDACDEHVDEAVLWWSHGGHLKGESPARIAFLKKILEEVPGQALRALPGYWDVIAAVPEAEPDSGYTLFYFTYLRPLFRDFHLDADRRFEVDVINTWEMRIEHRGIFGGDFRIPLGGRPYMAIRLRPVDR